MKDRIKELMEAQHMNQQTFSNYTGINTATLSGILTGRTQPTIKVVNSIMKKFPNVDLNWLMFGEGGMLNTSNPTPSSSSSDDASHDLFSSSHQQDFSHASQPGNDSIIVQPTAPSTPQPTAKPAPVHSVNMAVNPSFFDAPAPQNNAPVQSSSARQQTTISHIAMEPSVSPTLPKRRVTEIRIFYDDQTWEAFVPKNK